MMLVKSIILGVISFLVTARCEITEVVVQAGSQALLPCECSVPSCHPVAIIWSKVNAGTVWRKERNGLQYWGMSWSQGGTQRVRWLPSQLHKDDYSLQIRSVIQTDGGLFTCRMELSDRVIEEQVMLRITKVHASPSIPMWGEKVSVSCLVTPWPKGANVQWELNNYPFRPETGTVHSAIGSTVKEKATNRLMGNWTCVVKYSMKEIRSSISLSVKGIIQPPKDNALLYAALGSPFTFPCVFSPGLIATSTVWKKVDSGDLLTFDNNRSSSSRWDKSLKLKEVTMEDQGKYKCAGTVQGQTLSRTMQLVVAKIVQSKAQKGSVMLTCQLTDESEVTEYEWVPVTYDLNGTASVGPILKGQTVKLEGNWHEWTCRYYGKEGILGNVTHQVHLMDGLSGKISPGVSRNAGTVIGLSVLLVVLLLILAQMYKNHQRRKRIFQYPALETIVHTISNEREERERSRVKK